MKDPERILSCALDLGEMMLLSGGEVYRVEDTLSRILMAYGARRAHIFTITSSIVVTLETGENPITQTRRIYGQQTDLDKLNRLNALSRRICRETPDCDEIHRSLHRIAWGLHYNVPAMYFAYALISASFSLFFGGCWQDALVSALIGPFLLWLSRALQGLSLNSVLINALYAFAGGTVAALSVHVGLGVHFDKIVIGNIMLLIPGVALTNALRDLLAGDTLAGMTRLIQAVLIAIAVATGFALAGRWLG